jgi:prevent-host-death family protein
MKLSRQIKPISYLKAHAAEIVRSLGEQGEPLIITQNGEAKVVMQDIENHVLEKIEKAFASLTENPQRGAYPKELLALGLREYREIFFKPYRIIYRVMAENVYVLVVADGRRDMQALLQRRLLGV